MNILDQLAEYASERVKTAKEKMPLSEVRARAEELAGSKEESKDFLKALKTKELSFICECKKASPSKGLIAPVFDYLTIAKDYETAGANAISVLTEPKWFLGSDEYLREIAASVQIPVIRKDFTVDEYMIYEAKTLGASAVLLICSILDEGRLRDYLSLCKELHLSALTEAHDINEIETALKVSAPVIGVNNRNLKDFSVDPNNTVNLRKYVPGDVVFVAESGVKTAEDIKLLSDAGVDAVLIGETLMRAEDKKAKMKELKSLL